MIRTLRIISINYTDLDEIELRLIRAMEEVMLSSRRLIEPLFECINFGHANLNHWIFATSDIECGYCELEEILKYDSNGKPSAFGRKFVMLLEDYKDETLGLFYAGELINIATANQFLHKIPKRKQPKPGLYEAVISSIESAMRFRNKVLVVNEL